MNVRVAGVVVACVTLALVAEFVAAGHPEAKIWGGNIRDYWSLVREGVERVLLGIATVVVLAVALPVLARPLWRPNDFYQADDKDEVSNE